MALLLWCSALLLCGHAGHGSVLYLPNGSFESPVVPPVSPYAIPVLGSWQKSPQPAWYDPRQNNDTPWDYLMGTFYNVSFPGQFIDNVDGAQAAFVFAVPGAAIYQDFGSPAGTNSNSGEVFDATFRPGRSYSLRVGLLGGGGGMKPGATLELRLYFRDLSSNKVIVAATSVTNDSQVFPTNTHLVDFEVRVPAVQTGDAWANQKIGVEIVSTVGFDIPGGYWDVDNVRLVESIDIPNGSFESPVVPPVSPYATPAVDAWQKTAQPAWYDPRQNNDTPWEYLMGTFYNVSFPGQFIDNADGTQAAFLFAIPEAGLFQDYNSIAGTNTTPSHAFNAAFTPGKSYTMSVLVLGGGGGMKEGATLQLGLYYRDAASNIVTVAATTVTNTAANFPSSTHFREYQVQVPGVRATDPWAGRNIGIQLLSTAAPDLAGGYWDLDNVRLSEIVAPDLVVAQVSTNQVTLKVLSEPGARFEILASTNLAAGANGWTSVATITNVSGAGSFTQTIGSSAQQFYRARQL